MVEDNLSIAQYQPRRYTLVFKPGLVSGLILFLGLNSQLYAASWRRLDVGSNVSEARAIAIDRDNPDVIYAGLNQALYKTINQGARWRLLGSGIVCDINLILIDREDKKAIYVATQKGLFKSGDAGESWIKLFSGRDALEQDVLGISVCYQPPKTIFIATRGGIFFSPVNRIIWQKVSGKLNDAVAIFLAPDPHKDDTLYVVSDKGLFKSQDRLSSYSKVYAISNPEAEDSTSDVDSDEEEVSPTEYYLSHLAVDPRDSSVLYLGSLKGLLVSSDGGESWQKRFLEGLITEKINYLLISGLDEGYFIATQNGVFVCKGIRCQQFYQGADFKNCRQLALDSENNLYAATERGLYLVSLKDKNSDARSFQAKDIKMAKGFSQKEPTIQETQREAIRYAEVHPEKIANWRRQARLKAFIPELTLDYDKTVTTALGATYDRVQVGPRDWGLSLKWDLADLIFSTDQTSIDVRSRLMVQLRDDVLNNVTRLYFERKRLQQELVTIDNLDKKDRFEKELRLEEVTAFIDGLTGGYFKRALARLEE